MDAKLAAAIVAAQAELRSLPKDSLNPHFKNRYTSLDTMIETVRPILAKHGLAVIQGAEASPDGKAILVWSELVHTSGATFRSGAYVPMVKLDPQGAGGALTYGRRYSLAAALCISSDEDDDGNHASKPPANRAQRPAQPRSEPAKGAGPVSQPMAFDANQRMKRDEDKVFKGKRLGDYSTAELNTIIKQARAANNEALSEAIGNVLTDRSLGMTDDDKMARVHASVAAEDAKLPFGD